MRKRHIYLDACLFIARHKMDCSPEVQTCIQTLFSEIESGSLYALSSAATKVEVLAGSDKYLDEVMDGRRGEFLDASLPVMELARDIRKVIKIPILNGKPRTLDLPDCIHVASASIYRCECLVTIDEKTMLAAANDILKHFKVALRRPCEVATEQLVLRV